jgi:hypothetical protein
MFQLLGHISVYISAVSYPTSMIKHTHAQVHISWFLKMNQIGQLPDITAFGTELSNSQR